MKRVLNKLKNYFDLNHRNDSGIPDEKQTDEWWDKAWVETWRPLLFTDGELDEQKIANEMHDLVFVLRQVSEVYEHITGGALSKEMYFADTIIAKHNEQIEKAVDEALDEVLED